MPVGHGVRVPAIVDENVGHYLGVGADLKRVGNNVVFKHHQQALRVILPRAKRGTLDVRGEAEQVAVAGELADSERKAGLLTRGGRLHRGGGGCGLLWGLRTETARQGG